MLRKLLGLTFVAVALVSCGQSDLNNESDVAAPILIIKPDLQFSPLVVGIDWGGGLRAAVPGQVLRIPCQVGTIRVKFTYKNAGIVNAGAHHVRGFVTGMPSAVVAQPLLAAGTARTGFMSLLVGGVPANVVRDLSIYLDNFGAVTESSEGNNLLQTKIVKVCTAH